MLVTLKGFGGIWEKRSGNNPAVPDAASRAAYYNTTGVLVDGKLRYRWRVGGKIRFNGIGGFTPTNPVLSLNRVFECRTRKLSVVAGLKCWSEKATCPDRVRMRFFRRGSPGLSTGSAFRLSAAQFTSKIPTSGPQSVRQLATLWGFPDVKDVQTVAREVEGELQKSIDRIQRKLERTPVSPKCLQGGGQGGTEAHTRGSGRFAGTSTSRRRRPSLSARTPHGGGVHQVGTGASVRPHLNGGLPPSVDVCRHRRIRAIDNAGSCRDARGRTAGRRAMICVTIGRGRHSSLAEEWKAAAEAGVELVELRIDCLRRDPDIKRILANRPTPWSSRSAAAPTAASGAATKRNASNTFARRSSRASTTSTSKWTSPARSAGSARPSGSSATTISRRRPPSSGHRRAVRRDGRRHRQGRRRWRRLSPEASRGFSRSAEGHGPDDPHRDGRDRRLHPHPRPQIRRSVHVRRIQSRARLRPRHAPFTNDLKRDYLYEQINAETEIYGVIGDPIEQSLSPAIHNAAFRHSG